MKIKCWKCNGSGRLRDKPIDLSEVVLTFGVVPIIRLLCEGDKEDDRFWKDCDICNGKGYQYG